MGAANISYLKFKEDQAKKKENKKRPNPNDSENNNQNKVQEKLAPGEMPSVCPICAKSWDILISQEDSSPMEILTCGCFICERCMTKGFNSNSTNNSSDTSTKTTNTTSNSKKKVCHNCKTPGNGIYNIAEEKWEKQKKRKLERKR